ncbi:hypothetical protein ACHAAC_17155 [Aeromicrobium sp. CF4.19]|uniref:hypothetical protein n=1 Tax=Aeromicrobium sp. CF4.19 TaxID=3373082 RepID=UPI003EE78903
MTQIDEVVEQKAQAKPWVLIVTAVAVTALVVGAGVFFLIGDSDPSDAGAGGSENPSTNTLPTGEASVDLRTATGSVAGFPRRFPQSEAGAVEAYLGWSLAPAEAIQQPNEVLEEYYADVMPPEDAAAEAADVFAERDAFGLDEQGRFMGQPGTQPYADCLPEYGAYRSDMASKTEVEVEVWMPCVGGIGSPADTSNVIVFWSQSSALMTWRDGDWRTSSADMPDGTEAPTPASKEEVNVSFTERAQILGGGWEMFDGASQVWPVELLGQEPQ